MVDDIFEGSHMEFAAMEFAGERGSKSERMWLRWVDELETELADVLETDHAGKPTIDGNNSEAAKAAGTACGYSLDEAYEAWEAGHMVSEYARIVRWNIEVTKGDNARKAKK